MTREGKNDLLAQVWEREISFFFLLFEKESHCTYLFNTKLFRAFISFLISSSSEGMIGGPEPGTRYFEDTIPYACVVR